jgi:cytochrome c-type biogenesis protein CcmE
MIERMNPEAQKARSAPVDRRTAWKIVASVVVVVGSVSTLLYASMKEEIQLWKSPDELVGAPKDYEGKRLNVGGHVLSLNANRSSLEYSFEIESRPPRPHAVLKARYRGVVPDTFKSGAEVVATGKINPEGVLVAETIMAKCPSKYEAKGGPAIGSGQGAGAGYGAEKKY